MKPLVSPRGATHDPAGLFLQAEQPGPALFINTSAQVSGWAEQDVSVTCPAPRLLAVVPTSSPPLVARFDRRLDVASGLGTLGRPNP